MTPDSELQSTASPDAALDRSAANAPPHAKSQVSRTVREVVETLLLAALIFFLVRLVVLNFKVDGDSMLPNLTNDEMLLVNRNAFNQHYLNTKALKLGHMMTPVTPPAAEDGEL